MRRPELVLLGAGAGWHTARLTAALEARGIATERVSFAACGFCPGRPGLRLGALTRLPGAALVRSIPAGSFEQVTLRLSLLHALERAGAWVLNDARAIERCIDKAMTSHLLAVSGVPTPPAWTVETRGAAAAIVAAETAAGHKVAAKPLFGAQGVGLRLVSRPEELPDADTCAGVWHLQRYVGREAGWHDHRVFVVAGRPVAAMARYGTGWITNIRQGAMPVAARAHGAMAELAVAAAAAVGAFYAGVDVIEAPDGPTVLEVNSMPAWRGLQSVSEVDLAGELAAAIAGRLRCGR